MNKASWSRFVIFALAFNTLVAHAQQRPGQSGQPNAGSFPQYDDRRDPQRPQQPQQPSRPQQPQQPSQPIPPVVTQPSRPIPQQPQYPQYPQPQDDRWGRPDRDDRHHGPQYPGPQYPQQYDRDVAAFSLVSLRVNRDLYAGGSLDLEQLVQEQLGQTLLNAEIERIAVEGDPSGRVGQAMVGVELNGRLTGPMKPLSFQSRMVPLQVNSYEQIRTLRLIVSGSARIMDISIRVGNVRPQYNPYPQQPQYPGPSYPQPFPQQLPARILVNQEISPSWPLDLSTLTREYATVRTLRLETSLRSRIAANLTVINRYGQTVGRAMISSGITLVVITQQSSLSDLRIFTDYPVLVGSIEAELDRPYGR